MPTEPLYKQLLLFFFVYLLWPEFNVENKRKKQNLQDTGEYVKVGRRIDFKIGGGGAMIAAL